MPIPAKLNLYRGRMLSLADLSRATGIRERTLAAWHRRFGRVSELRIARHLRERAERKAVRELADAHGVPMTVVRNRVFRGMDPDDAASLPLKKQA